MHGALRRSHRSASQSSFKAPAMQATHIYGHVLGLVVATGFYLTFAVFSFTILYNIITVENDLVHSGFYEHFHGSVKPMGMLQKLPFYMLAGLFQMSSTAIYVAASLAIVKDMRRTRVRMAAARLHLHGTATLKDADIEAARHRWVDEKQGWKIVVQEHVYQESERTGSDDDDERRPFLAEMSGQMIV